METIQLLKRTPTEDLRNHIYYGYMYPYVSKYAQLQIMGTNSGAKSDCSMLCPFVNNYYYMKQSSSHCTEENT